MRTSELLAKVSMQPVSRAKNLGKIGWADGYMVVQFHGRPDLWIYGPDIPELKHDQILKNPYPDSLFHKAIREKFKAFKVPDAKSFV